MAKATFGSGSPPSSQGLSWKTIATLAGVVTLLIGGIVLFIGGSGHNDYENWQLKQGVFGDVAVIDTPGWYYRNFAHIWTYPRSVQVFYSASPKEGNPEDESIDVTFNDGGNAQVSTMVRYTLPTDSKQREKLHQAFSGNIHNVTAAVRAHLVNCLKNTAPVMSASEHQSARKAEFNLLVEEQFRNGLYEMKKVEKTLKDQYDQGGKPITVYATEVVVDEKGKPIIVYSSPLTDYGIQVAQFSVTGTEYDPKTKEQFAAKKESYLAAEKSKAQQQQEVQQRLMTVEKGLREKAEVEAIANKEMAQAVIEATKKVRVAEQAKAEAETVANQKLSVAKIDKEEGLTKANKDLEIAVIRTKAAEQDALATKTIADAEAMKIAKGGAITEKERVLAQILADRDAKVAKELAQIRGPQIVFGGGSSGTSNGGDWQNGMWNLIMLRAAGINIGNGSGSFAPLQQPQPESK